MAVVPEGGTAGQRAQSKRVVNEEIAQGRAPDLDSYGRWARGIDIRAAADAGAAMAVVLREQLELRPSVALQKKVGLKSLEQARLRATATAKVRCVSAPGAPRRRQEAPRPQKAGGLRGQPGGSRRFHEAPRRPQKTPRRF